jgi:4-amino-4-deoxy-L-arabinose transferase-like glycosyltransferase
MARNYYENGYSFARPQVDWGGSSPGYVEAEFPSYPFAAALLYGFTGVREAIGRVLSILGFLVAAGALYALTRAILGDRTALWSTILFLFLPLNTYYSRAFMPESWMVMASVLGILFFYRWCQYGRARELVYSGAFVAFAALLKLPCLYLGLPLMYLAWTRYGAGFFKRRELWLYALAVFAPVVLWYTHAHQIERAGGLSFGIWAYGSDKWGNWDLVRTWEFWNGILFRSIGERWLTWAGVPLMIWGIALPRRSSGERLFDAWLVAILIYFVIVARGNYVHEYYQFPIMPVACVYMGKVLSRYVRATSPMPLRLALAAMVLAVGVLSAWRYASYVAKEDPRRSSELAVARAAQRFTEPGSLVITPTGGNPTLLYLSHRKGWTVRAEDLTPAFLSARRAEGARYIVGTGPAARSEGDQVLYRSEQGYVLSLQ